MGTTADKLNQLINTKEGIRQEINRAYRTEEISTSDTFNNYIQKLMEHPFYLNGVIEGNIESVKLYNATSIGRYAFYECASLTEASLPNATSIGGNAFAGCTSLTEVSVPNATSIGAGGFFGCTSLTEVSVPNATSIGESVFTGCEKLTTIDLSSVTSIEKGTFRGLVSLKNLDISSVRSIALPTEGSSNIKRDGAFYDCRSLTSLNLPGITTLRGGHFVPFFPPPISYSVFNGSSLISLSLPNITYMDDYALCDCNTLTTLYIGTNISTVCNLGDTYSIPSNVATIYVPASLVDSYKSATNWSSYADKIKAAP